MPSTVAGNAADEDTSDDPSAAPDLICIGRLWLSFVTARALLVCRCSSSAAAAASEAALEVSKEDGVFNDRVGVAVPPDSAEYAFAVEVASPIDDKGLAEVGGGAVLGTSGGAVAADQVVLVRDGAAAAATATADDVDAVVDVNAPDAGRFLLAVV